MLKLLLCLALVMSPLSPARAAEFIPVPLTPISISVEVPGASETLQGTDSVSGAIPVTDGEARVSASVLTDGSMTFSTTAQRSSGSTGLQALISITVEFEVPGQGAALAPVFVTARDVSYDITSAVVSIQESGDVFFLVGESPFLNQSLRLLPASNFGSGGRIMALSMKSDGSADDRSMGQLFLTGDRARTRFDFLVQFNGLSGVEEGVTAELVVEAYAPSASGDLNGDGAVDIADSVTLRRLLAGKRLIP